MHLYLNIFTWFKTVIIKQCVTCTLPGSLYFFSKRKQINEGRQMHETENLLGLEGILHTVLSLLSS